MDQTFAVDLHVHSRFSTRPSQWVLQKLGCPESFTAPLALYRIARARGMDMVTITDHNTIDGALEIAHLDHTFVSEEITTYFPEDRCKLHVLAYDIDESIHKDIQMVRDNVFDLVDYLRQKGIVHVLAHPLFAVNDRLTVHHFEQCLLLFDVFEMNGTRDADQNRALERIAASLTPEAIHRLADRHNLHPRGETPWLKTFTGGSDDHSSLNITRMHTVLPGPATKDNLLDCIASGRTTPRGVPATPQTMAHNLYGIAYQFYKGRIPGAHSASSHVCLRFADNALDFPHSPRRGGLLTRIGHLIGSGKTRVSGWLNPGRSTQDLLLEAATDLIRQDEQFSDLALGRLTNGPEIEEAWSRFVSRASNRVLSTFADRTLQSVTGANIFDIFSTIGSAGSLYALLAPYFVGYTLFASERAFSRRCLEAFGLENELHKTRVAVFTDAPAGHCETFGRVHLGCDPDEERVVVSCMDLPGVRLQRTFMPVGRCELDDLPGAPLAYPPFLDMLAYCFEQDFDRIEVATPGPVGLAGLGIARILKRPCHGRMSACLPRFLRSTTHDTSIEDGAARYLSWLCNQMDFVTTPSVEDARALVAMGVTREIEILTSTDDTRGRKAA